LQRIISADFKRGPGESGIQFFGNGKRYNRRILRHRGMSVTIQCECHPSSTSTNSICLLLGLAVSKQHAAFWAVTLAYPDFNFIVGLEGLVADLLYFQSQTNAME
jgi:hypothetical protein